MIEKSFILKATFDERLSLCPLVDSFVFESQVLTLFPGKCSFIFVYEELVHFHYIQMITCNIICSRALLGFIFLADDVCP